MSSINWRQVGKSAAIAATVAAAESVARELIPKNLKKSVRSVRPKRRVIPKETPQV